MKILEHTYRPLPSALTIHESLIDGLGLFVKINPGTSFGDKPGDIYYRKGDFIGITHIHSAVLDMDEFDFTTVFEQDDVNMDRMPGAFFQKDDVFPNGLIRTPLGGFINHSDDPNIVLTYLNHGLWGIIADKDIKCGDEIVVDYKYTPCGVITK